MPQQKVLMVLFNSNGDSLYGTVIAKQIKEVDYPGCHLTWAINTNCKQSIVNNPFVDKIWEVKTKKVLTDIHEWNDFKNKLEQSKSIH
jgi:ADP-heptose:LPS heptosyltransferase